MIHIDDDDLSPLWYPPVWSWMETRWFYAVCRTVAGYKRATVDEWKDIRDLESRRYAAAWACKPHARAKKIVKTPIPDSNGGITVRGRRRLVR